MPPPDLARGNERIRTRFLSRLMVNPSPWRIAKALLPDYADGYGEAGLRGLMDLRGGDLTWWIANHCSHAQAYNLLGIARGDAGDHLEIEINTLPNGTMYAAWQRCEDGAEAPFLAHPMMTGLVDGCLAHNGRQLRLRGGRIQMLDAAAAEDDVLDHRAIRLPHWQALLAQAEGWARTRRKTDRDGSPIPPMSSVRPYREWLRDHQDWRSGTPLPQVGVDPRGAIVASWRGTASFARARFENDAVSLFANLDGRVIESAPRGNRTLRERRSFPDMTYSDAVRRMRSAHDDMEIPPQ